MRHVIMLLLILTVVTAGNLSNSVNKRVPEQDNSWDIIVPDDYGSIQEAINEAAEGETIYIKSGIYNEHIIINKTLKIIGEDRETTIIQGKTGILVKIASDNVIFSGFWLRDGETGIYLKGVRNCRIIGNKFENFSRYSVYTGGVALYAEHCSNLTIIENFFTEIDYFNAYLVSSNNCSIANNTFISTRRMSQAIGLKNSHNNIIEWNKIYGSRFDTEGGIGLSSSNRNIIRFNDIRNNDWCGISLRNSNETIIIGNNLTEHKTQTGIYINGAFKTIIYCNNFVDNLKDVIIISAGNTSWSYMGLGNYWDKYVGEDRNFDGVGDIPYTLEGQNDTCPLMGPYHPFRLPDGKIIDVISNSTIIEFNYTGSEEITLKVTGEPETIGFCLIKIPNAIQNPHITVNGETPLKVNVRGNENFMLLYMLYLHEKEENKIEIIIPEYSFYFLILLTALTLQVFLRRRINILR